MRRGFDCPMCGQQDCGMHDSVLTFVNMLDRCALVGVGLLLAAVLALTIS